MFIYSEFQKIASNSDSKNISGYIELKELKRLKVKKIYF